MSDPTDRLLRLAKETGEMRRELVHADEYGDEITLTLSGKDLAAVVYSLAVAYISEFVAGENGHQKLMGMIGDASACILSVEVSPEIDKAINKILGDADAA